MAHGIPEMLGLVQAVPVDLCTVCNLKNCDMKKDYETGIAGICMIATVILVVLAAIIL